MTSEDVSTQANSRTSKCCLVILHENEEALNHATKMCDRITGQASHNEDLQLNNWSIESLVEETIANEAADLAGDADVVVIAASGYGTFPEAFRQWTEQWLVRRQSREGTLVWLFRDVKPAEGSHWDVQLHQLALRAGMDYLKHLPDQLTQAIPDVTEWCATRAETYTGTLDQIIRNEPKPIGHRSR